jgi:polyphosphate kinase 2 (PPK2 family)
LNDPSKHWKFSPDDIAERARWDDYQKAYEHMLRGTSSTHAPWYVVPADHKWFAHAVVSTILCEQLDALRPEYPEVPKEMHAKLAAAREKLEGEAG